MTTFYITNLVQENSISIKPTASKMLYWNLDKKDLSFEVVELVKEIPYDILFFSETSKEIRKALENQLSPLGYRMRTKIVGRVRVALFDKYNDSDITFFKKEGRFTIIIYNFDGENYMVVGVHLDSPASYPDSSDRYTCAKDEYSTINVYREKYNVKKVVIIGDFNMNPYDRGMISELSFKATHCKKTAKLKSKKEYLFNPSWKIFTNDLTVDENKPPGTIHYVPRTKDSDVNYWHVFDQVLVSPSLYSAYLDSFDVITEWNNVKLLNEESIPDRTKYSDHLPITYTIEIRGENIDKC